MTNHQADAAQQAVIDRARTVLPKDPRILGVFLVGSHASGRSDAYSDIDVQCVISDESEPYFREHWPELVELIAGPCVMSDPLPFLFGGLAITEEWLHIDIGLHPRSQFDTDKYDARRVLFDRDGTLMPTGDRTGSAGQPGEPYYPAVEVRRFFYFLGNLVTVLQREELVVAQAGIIAVREELVALMLAERGVRRTGGVKRLRPFISAEQLAFLESIPAAGADREQIIAANQVICREFVRRGEALAERTGSPWPQKYVDATFRHLRRHLNADFA
jgi:hypothetical protein